MSLQFTGFWVYYTPNYYCRLQGIPIIWWWYVSSQCPYFVGCGQVTLWFKCWPFDVTLKLVKNKMKVFKSRSAIKYILSDSSSDYKSRLMSLHNLPLIMLFELQDIIFFIMSLTGRSDLFNILDHALFASSHTKSTKFAKLCHQASKTDLVRHLYFRHLPYMLFQ